MKTHSILRKRKNADDSMVDGLKQASTLLESEEEATTIPENAQKYNLLPQNVVDTLADGAIAYYDRQTTIPMTRPTPNAEVAIMSSRRLMDPMSRPEAVLARAAFKWVLCLDSSQSCSTRHSVKEKHRTGVSVRTSEESRRGSVKVARIQQGHQLRDSFWVLDCEEDFVLGLGVSE